MIDLATIPILETNQGPVEEQIAALVAVANRLGLYKAADAVVQMTPKLPALRYGCHCDLEPGQQPDGCVLDEQPPNPQNCIYAAQLVKYGQRREQCKYWKIIRPGN